MLKKSHALALAVTTAGLIGFCAPMASAATTAPAWNQPGSHTNAVVNISHNQLPMQACGNNADINGAGGQVPAEGDAIVGSLGSPRAWTQATAKSKRGCTMTNSQGKSGHSTTNAVVNISNNQVPVQACGNDVLGNAAGGQVPLSGVAGAISLLSPGAISMSHAVSSRGCSMMNSQNG